ncbi:MAG: 2-C-methyl-D-erythritol 2,4-cyclodiphosphate synthase [Candidatus Syntrophosphaera sp.]
MFRIGFGYDVHTLAPGRKLILGGVDIPFEKGLEGHSDADALIHSIIDAILGALALGDIGSHFPDTDEAYRDADSRELLREAFSLVREKGFATGNLDCTVCAEKPRVQSYIPRMRENIASDLGCAVDRVSVKATTEEGLGVSGQGRGIAAYCVLILERS